MVIAHTFNQGIHHPPKASSLSPLENPFLSNRVSLRSISVHEVLYVGINMHWFVYRSLSRSLCVYFSVFPLQEMKHLCFHVGTSEETFCSGFPSKKCLVLGENSLHGQSIFWVKPMASSATPSAWGVLLASLTETSNKKQLLLLMLAIFRVFL